MAKKQPPKKKAAAPKSAPKSSAPAFPVGKPIKFELLKEGMVVSFSMTEKDNKSHPQKDEFAFGSFRGIVRKDPGKDGRIDLQVFEEDDNWEMGIDGKTGTTSTDHIIVSSFALIQNPKIIEEVKALAAPKKEPPKKAAPKKNASARREAAEPEEEDEDYDDGGVQYEL